MASSQLSFGLLATTFVSLASFAQSQPAGSVVSPDSKAGVPLFQAETVQLTEESIGLLDSEYAHLFASDDGKVKKSFGSSCKILPGDPSWPDASIWDEFDSLLDGALLPIIPIASPCYLNSTFDNYDEAECAAIMQEWTTSEFQYVFPSRILLYLHRPVQLTFIAVQTTLVPSCSPSTRVRHACQLRTPQAPARKVVMLRML